jgi:hypothetical protein
MSAAFWFWGFMLLWAISRVRWGWLQRATPGYWWYGGGDLIVFIILCILGLHEWPHPFATLFTG